MKIRVELQADLKEDEVVIRCVSINENILNIQNLLSNFGNDTKSITLVKGDTEYFIPKEQILFFETESKIVFAHTAEKMYETPYRLYELEEILPRYFMRISKSTIVNLNQIYSITKNITASSVVEFYGSIKKVYVSRNYYKALIERMSEKRRNL